MKEQKALLAVKVDPAVAERVKHFCRERGLKYGFFVEKAVVEKMALEELKEDLVDLKSLRDLEDKAVPLDSYVKKRRV
jgi:molybdopterin-guanine dinucleotide biosynthesis protein A